MRKKRSLIKSESIVRNFNINRRYSAVYHVMVLLQLVFFKLSGAKYPYILILLGCATACQKSNPEQLLSRSITFEKINYYKYPTSAAELPFQSRLTYYFDNGTPHRWMELDSLGRVMTDYIYEYDNNGKQTGARYREDGAITFSVEIVSFKNDSTKVTQWIDSLGQVYYTMIDHLNQNKKTYRAEFIGDKTHGYDTTFYTREGFEKRIFFTSTRGKVFNDRRFVYDSINDYGDWSVRKKIMNDTITELHKREVFYDNNFVSADRMYYPGIVSTGEWAENVISFSQDEATMLLTRTSDWKNQSAFISHLKYGLFTETNPIKELDSIYNGAISPNSDQILYSVRRGDQEDIYLINKKDKKWSDKINLTASSGIEGGYFFWADASEIYFQTTANKGDIVKGNLTDETLTIVDNLAALNTENGTEFSPFIDNGKRFIIFTRYTEADTTNQGFFISYNDNNFDNPKWSIPKKLTMLSYGWGAYIINNGKQFVYTDGEDVYSIPVAELTLEMERK